MTFTYVGLSIKIGVNIGGPSIYDKFSLSYFCQIGNLMGCITQIGSSQNTSEV